MTSSGEDAIEVDQAPRSPHADRVGEAVRRSVEEFLYREARLADESRYTEWEALAEPDMFYWISRGEGEFDRDRQVSITADNRNRLANRIKQLNTGVRHAQVPPSPMRRMVSNIEISPLDDPSHAECVRVEYNFVLYEFRVQSTQHLQVWPGRMQFHLRRRGDSWGMFFKRVSPVNGSGPLPSIAFIL